MTGGLAGNGDPRSEIVGRLYDVALDPARYEELLDIWEHKVSAARPGAIDQGQLFADVEIEAHFKRANIILDRAGPPRDARAMLLDEFRTAAAFVIEPDLQVSQANPAAETSLGVRPDTPLSALPIDSETGDHLQHALDWAFAGRGPNTLLLRVRSTRTERVALLQIRLVTGDDPFALVVTSEFEWSAALDRTLAEAFGLSPSELVVIRGVVEARSLKEIADLRQRSIETIRTQLKAIFQKTDTHGQAELIRICLSLMDVVAVTEAVNETIPPSSGGSARLEPRPFQTLMRPDGRRFDYLLLGNPGGRPLLYLPLDYGFVRWPALAEAEAARRGLCVIVPVRAGFGASTSLPAQIGPKSYGDALAEDAHALLDHLRVQQCAILGLGSDSWYAHHIAAQNPGRFQTLLMVAGTLPMTQAAQYERMGKWHRFINANARYAPKVFPFMVKAGFSLARRIGRRAFLHAVYTGCPADVSTIEDPEVLEAILAGSEVALSKAHSAHDAFAREVLAQTLDWSDVVQACRRIPTHFMMGDQDQHAPPETVNEWEREWPHIHFERVANSGYLLFFQRWRMVLDQLDRTIRQPATSLGL